MPVLKIAKLRKVDLEIVDAYTTSPSPYLPLSSRLCYCLQACSNLAVMTFPWRSIRIAHTSSSLDLLSDFRSISAHSCNSTIKLK